MFVIDYFDLFWVLCGGGGGNFGVIILLIFVMFFSGDFDVVNFNFLL